MNIKCLLAMRKIAADIQMYSGTARFGKVVSGNMTQQQYDDIKRKMDEARSRRWRNIQVRRNVPQSYSVEQATNNNTAGNRNAAVEGINTIKPQTEPVQPIQNTTVNTPTTSVPEYTPQPMDIEQPSQHNVIIETDPADLMHSKVNNTHQSFLGVPLQHD